MIRITYDKKNRVLTCTGHAGAGEPGKDVVCAACSMLICGLANSVCALRYALSSEPQIRLASGDARIACTPAQGFCGTVDLVFWSYLMGVRALTENYPDNVEFNITEQRK